MKIKLCAIVFIISSCAYSQQSNVIRVRKVQYDTSFYTTQTWDSSYVENSSSISIEPVFYENQLGYWHENIFFSRDTLYVFSSEISMLDKRIAKRNPSTFWKKINRKIKKNKLSVFQVGYQLMDVNSNYRIDTITNTHFQIRNRETGQITRDESIIIKSDTGTNSYFFRRYRFVSEHDTIELARLRQNQFICSNSKNYQHCLFSALVDMLKKNYKNSMPYGHFRLNSMVDGNKYNMYLNFESQLCRKAIFIENSKKRFYVDYELEKDSIFIPNSPVGQIYGGKIARKKNKIRFRANRKNYIFYSRKQLGYSKHWFSPTVDEYYQYSVVIE